jgi:hypothetical protein
VSDHVIDISICPTSLEFGCGDVYDEGKLLESLREFCLRQHRGSRVSLQVGHRQGDEWATVNGDDELGQELVQEFFERHGGDQKLFKGK